MAALTSAARPVRRNPPPGYDVVRVPALGRYVALRIDRDPQSGAVLAIKPMVQDGRIRLFTRRDRAVLELTVLVQQLELDALRDLPATG